MRGGADRNGATSAPRRQTGRTPVRGGTDVPCLTITVSDIASGGYPAAHTGRGSRPRFTGSGPFCSGSRLPASLGDLPWPPLATDDPATRADDPTFVLRE